MDRWDNRDRDRDWRDRWRDDDDRSRYAGDRNRDDGFAHERDPRWGGIPGYHAGGDFGWRGTELDRGFGGRYEYDRDRDVNRGLDRGLDRIERERQFSGANRDYGRYDRERTFGDRYARETYRDEPYRNDPYRNDPYRNDSYRNDPYPNAPRRADVSRGRSEQERYAGDDRYRTMSGDPYRDRGYERARDFDRDRERSMSERDRERGDDYWDDYPWSSRRW